MRRGKKWLRASGSQLVVTTVRRTEVGQAATEQEEDEEGAIGVF